MSINKIFFCLVLNTCLGVQEPSVKKLDNQELSMILNNIESMKKYEVETFSIVIFLKSNKSGSANLGETDEVSHSYLIGISEHDEFPKQSLYQIGNFINPQIQNVIYHKKKIELWIEHGIYNSRRQIGFIILQDSIEKF